ncbi:MAG: Hsp20/alpha crystallin family protein [Gemmatimonadaceae bacterium]
MPTTRASESRDEHAQQSQRSNQNPNQQQQGTSSGREAGGTARESQRAIQTTTEPVRGGISRRGTAPAAGYGTSGTPFSLMRRMAEDMDRIMEDFGFGPSLGIAPLLSSSSGLGRGTSSTQTGVWAPQLETFRRGDKLVVRADLPGLRKEDVNVEVDDGVLTITGHRAEEQVDDRDDYYRSERSYGQFFRALPLPDGVTGDQCEATFNNGVLEVTLPLPKEQERKAKRIEVK